MDEEKARQHGVSLEHLKQFDQEESHRHRLWEAVEGAPKLRILLNLWWKVIDHDGATPSINLSLHHEIRRLQNQGQELSHLVQLIQHNPFLSPDKVIARLEAMR